MTVDPQAVRTRAYELSVGPEAGTPEENWLRAERELGVAYPYDTVDRDLERNGMAVWRCPSEAGVVWRLDLPRGERVEAWEPGNNGLAPPDGMAHLISAVTAGKPLAPTSVASADPGAVRLRDMLDAQRQALLRNDPGVRLGDDPENLHQHRVAARRIRAFLRATRTYVDPTWRRLLDAPLQELGRATGPARDLDVLLEHVREEVRTFDERDRTGVEALLAQLQEEREAALQILREALDGDAYRLLLTRLRLPPRTAERVPLRKIARKEFRRLAKAIDRLGRDPDDASIHALRIELKRARYAAELSSPTGKRGERFIADAKTVQDLLGRHQDAVVAEEHLRRLGSHGPAAFVAGRLAERQVARRHEVRKRLPAAWKRLRKSGARLH